MIYELKLNDATLNLKDVMEFLDRMFKDKGGHRVVIVPEDKTLKVDVFDEIGNKVTEALCPPNIKEGAVLGYYYANKNLCMLPLRNRTFILKKGCKHRKSIRPLFSLQKVRKEKEKWKAF